MDAAAAALSLHLLFLPISPMHRRYAALSERELPSSPAAVERRLELVRFLESGGKPSRFDSGDEERDEMRAEEFFGTGMGGRLSVFEFGQEKFLAGRAPSGGMSVTNANSDFFWRTQFDSSHRPVERIVWRNSGAREIVSKSEWTYGEGSSVLEEELVAEKKLSRTEFDSLGLARETREFSLSGGARKITRSRKFEYDEEKRVLREEEVLFHADGKRYSRGNVFTYTEISGLPDIDFFENGILRRSVRYSGENNYSETIYFQEGFVVQSVYENGIKTEERISSSE